MFTVHDIAKFIEAVTKEAVRRKDLSMSVNFYPDNVEVTIYHMVTEGEEREE